jgi:glycosyltransferase involved in cell wall biosynthesis
MTNSEKIKYVRQKRVLCLFDYGPDCHTGFATVSRNIMKHVKAHFGDRVAFDICAVNYFGEPYEEDGGTVFSAKRSDVKNDDFGRFVFLKVLKEDDYDGVFIIQDLGVIQPIIPILQTIQQEKREQGRIVFKSVWYFPVDCRLFPTLVKNIEFFDHLVTYTEFARQEVLRLKPSVRGKLSVIYHGSNPKDFYPMSEEKRQEARKNHFGSNADKFIITNVNRNQPRKDLPNTIFGFIEAKANWTYERKPYLYLHCHPHDPMGWDLRALLMQTELQEWEDYQLIHKRWETNMATVAEVNEIYNASDLYVTTTLGEGWGLGITEAMATRLPVIIPNTTSMTEIGGNGSRAYMLDTIIPFCGSNDNIIREQTDYIEVYEKMVEVAGLCLSGKTKEKLDKAEEFVKTIEWKPICKRWSEVFEKLL